MSDNDVPQDQGPGRRRALLLVGETFPRTQGHNVSAQEQSSMLQLTPELANSLATVYKKPGY